MAPRGALTRFLVALALIVCATATASAQATTTANATTTAPTTSTPATAGGWKTVSVTDRESALLERALGNVSNYRTGVTARVCVREIKALTQQVVAGTNYRFVVEACSVTVNSDKNVGLCAGKSGVASWCNEYTIRVFEQMWTNTLEVVAIESNSGTAPSTETPASSSPNGTTTTTTSAPTTASPSGSNNSTKSNATDTKTPVVTTTTAPKDSAASTRSIMNSVAFVALLVLASVVA